MLYSKRGNTDGVGKRLGLWFGRFFSPNQLTFLSIIFAIITFYFIIESLFVWAALAFIITALLDFLDGAVAKSTGRATKKGAYLDTVVDRYVEFIIIFALLFVLDGFVIWLMLYLFGSIMTTYAKAGATEKGLLSSSDGIGRPERMILLFVGLVLAIFDTTLLGYMIIILAVLSNLTAFWRIGKGLKW